MTPAKVVRRIRDTVDGVTVMTCGLLAAPPVHHADPVEAGTRP